MVFDELERIGGFGRRLIQADIPEIGHAGLERLSGRPTHGRQQQVRGLKTDVRKGVSQFWVDERFDELPLVVWDEVTEKVRSAFLKCTGFACKVTGLVELLNLAFYGASAPDKVFKPEQGRARVFRLGDESVKVTNVSQHAVYG